MKIYIMRHGEVFSNNEPKRYLGVTDLPMNEKGRQSVRKAADRLLKSLIQQRESLQRRMLVISPLKRSRETAEILQEYLLFSSVYEDDDFSEIDLGEWEMQEIMTVREAYPEEYRQRGENMTDHRTLGGETFRETGKRFAKAFHRWSKRAKEEEMDELFIISHRGAILSGFSELVKVPCEEMLNKHLEYAGILIMDETGCVKSMMLPYEQDALLYKSYCFEK